jgi:hypothetical protein
MMVDIKRALQDIKKMDTRNELRQLTTYYMELLNLTPLEKLLTTFAYNTTPLG